MGKGIFHIHIYLCLYFIFILEGLFSIPRPIWVNVYEDSILFVCISRPKLKKQWKKSNSDQTLTNTAMSAGQRKLFLVRQ